MARGHDELDLATEAALEAERQFVISLGGLGIELPGATLVLHDKIPVPRFNFVQEVGVGPERQAHFFEHALDQYFQRALRPTFRVPRPVPAHLDAGLRRLGFRARDVPLRLLLATPVTSTTEPDGHEVRPARDDELDLVASFWTGDRERPEFRVALDVTWHHPNPLERLVPVLALRHEAVVSAALVYRHRSTAGIHAVATRPEARGRGSASDLVRYVLDTEPAGPASHYALFADSDRLVGRLIALGFRAAREFQEYLLPENAELTIGPPGPEGPPRWRPPRPTDG